MIKINIKIFPGRVGNREPVVIQKNMYVSICTGCSYNKYFMKIYEKYYYNYFSIFIYYKAI